MFKSDFKYYKSKCPPPDLSTLLDFNNASTSDGLQVVKTRTVSSHHEDRKLEAIYGLQPINDWKLYELVEKPGLIFIPNPFTPRGQRYWVCRCVKDYTDKPHKLNLDKHGHLEKGQKWWTQSAIDKSLLTRLRWATLGYHHNWDTKVYSESDRDVFPTDLGNLSRYIVHAAGFSNFEAEAAIVNYYYMDSTLSGHTDYSEPNRQAPLISLSFGQSAIFLIGGLTREEKPTAMYIHSGDVVIMSEESRLNYHGVPRILRSETRPWVRPAGSNLPLFETSFTCYSSDTRKSEVPDKRLKTCIESECENLGCNYDLLKDCVKEEYWERFEKYLETSRINMNVRQVLRPGQKSLEGGEVSL